MTATTEQQLRRDRERAVRTDGHRAREDRSLGELLRELSTEGRDLVQQEIALAKAEMNQKIEVFQTNSISIATGGALLLASLLFALWAANMGVTALLAQFMTPDVAIWLSPLLLAAVLGMIGLGMVKKGQSAIKSEGITPQRTTSTLKEDTRWAREKAREVRQEVQHG